MNVGKAIYYLLSNATDVTDICGTRIFPEVAEQESATPLVVYEIINVDPDDTNDGPAKLDEVTVDVVCYADTYDVAADLASVCRVALDRVRGTYNGVNVESIQFQTVDSQVIDSPRRYVMAATFIVRVKRDLAQIATGRNIDDLTILRLADTPSDYGTTGQALVVNADGDGMEWGQGGGAAALPDLTDVNDEITADAIDREAVVYDEATGEWIAGGVSQTTIPIRNSSQTQLNKGAVVAFAGNQGDRILVEAWDNASASAYIVGVLDANLPGGADGHAVSYGEIRALDTSAYTLNNVLHANTGGTFTTVPNSLPIATVTRVHANTGRIFVRTYVPGDHYRDRYRAEASAKVTAASLDAGETVETYYTAQADGDAFYRRKLSDTTKNAGDVVRRTYYYKSGSFGDVDTTGYTEVVMDDDSTHDELIAAIQTHLNTNAAPLTVWSKRAEVAPPETLLDEFPGAALALSPARRLRADYTGAAINVRRASDNAAQDIGFDGDGELDTSALATFCAGTDGFIVRWYDQSGNGNDAVQATTSFQRKIHDATNGVITYNGKPASFRTGNDGQLVHDIPAGTTWTSFAVVKINSFPFGVHSRVPFTPWWYLADGGGGSLTAGFSNVALWINTAASTSVSRLDLQNELGTNHVLISARGDLAETGTNQWRVGSAYGDNENYNVKGYLQEVVIYNSDQSANRAGIEANINAFYSIY